MKRKRISRAKGSRARKQREPLPWKYSLVTIFFGVLLASGFFLAARQHFFAVENGFENSKLRKQVEDLRYQNRLLRLKKEAALSPREITQAARKLGFVSTTVHNFQTADHRTFDVPVEPADTTLQVPAAEIARTVEKQKQKKAHNPANAPAKAKVVKTVASKPVEKAEKPEKKPDASATPVRSRIADITARK